MIVQQIEMLAVVGDEENSLAFEKSVRMGTRNLGVAIGIYFQREARRRKMTVEAVMLDILGPDAPSCGYGLQTCAAQRLAA